MTSKTSICTHQLLSRLAAGATAVLVLAACLVVWAPTAHAALLPGTPNNPWPSGCALRLGVSIDRSNSILDDSPFNPGLIRQAVAGLVDGLAGSGMEVGVWSFGTAASGYVGPNPLGPDPSSEITAADYPSIGFTSTDTPAGRLAIASTVDAIPFASESSPQAQRTKGWTNWEAGLGGASSGYVVPGATAPGGDTPSDADIVIVITDGSPTVPGPPELGWTVDDPVNYGVRAADAIKADGDTRVVAIGVGSAVDVANLERITGGLGTSLPNDDYYFIARYDELLGALLESVANSCGGAAIARKYELSPQGGTGGWQPSAGRPMEIGFDRQPPSLNPQSTSTTTGAGGETGWSWIGDGGAYDVTLAEMHLPAERLWSSRCRMHRPDGTAGPWTDYDLTSVTVTVANADSIECEWFNYVADPRISVVKRADPTRLDGPEGPVTYRVEVANTSPQGLERIRLDSLVDDRFGDLLDPANPLISSDDCPSLSGSILEPGAVEACSFVAVVEGDPARPHVDVVTAVATEVRPDGGDGLEVTASDDAEVHFDAAPTTTTTEPPTTTTVVPSTTLAPMPPAPPPAPEPPVAPRKGSLPVTGAPVAALVLAGTALVTGGTAIATALGARRTGGSGAGRRHRRQEG